jgi:hypothetical protein
MVKERVAAVVDFSSQEYVICADMLLIKETYFPDESWMLVATCCAPADICHRLDKVDRMISRDEQEEAVHTVEKNEFVIG